MAVELPPIIIKKIKKGGNGHHGGAWKVAFADFVTAMMAFFMLMWLLGSTTPEQKAAVANYMNNPLADAGPGGAGANIVLDGGDGILEGNGPSAFAQAATSDANVQGTGAPSPQDAAEIAAQAEATRMAELLEELKSVIDASESLKPFKDQLLLDITSEGLRIQIVDKENRAMFGQGSPVLENYMREILREVSTVINQVPNKISISGHTDQSPYASNNGYSNWELSSDRANAARRELVAGGIAEAKIGRVVGLASSVLFDKENPFGPINRRISIIVMNKAAEEAVVEGEGRALEIPKITPAAGAPVPELNAPKAAAAAPERAAPPVAIKPKLGPPQDVAQDRSSNAPETVPPATESPSQPPANAPSAPPPSAPSASPPAAPVTPPPTPITAPPVEKPKKVVKIAIG